MTIIIFIIVLAILIFVHELGHFLFARWNGIRVDEFKIGFGPKIFAWGKGETKYGLNLIPFGGFVKIHGENPDNDSINGPDKARSFVNKKKWQQITVLAAGVFFNFLFAWLIYTSIFIFGVTATTGGFQDYASNFTNERIMITNISAGSPAEKAGLKMGDIINGVNDNVVDIKPDQAQSFSVSEIQNVINSSNGEPVSFSYVRGKSKTTTIQVIPEKGIIADKYAIGIAMDNVVDLRLPFFTAIYEGGHYTLVMIRDTTIGLYNFFADIFRGTANFSDVSGPIGIAGIVGDAAGLGFTYLLMITALISINLGVINFIPFPALDGGRILFAIIEGIIRRNIPANFANIVNAIGFILLMILMVVVTYKDIAKLF
ncbi:MAG: site-2 protease family protein [Candidatus Paceibacterota bacterium]|jgi:regulator of sigma E protease